MRVEPAHVDQIMAARDGRMVLIDKDAGGVAADLAAIDPGLRVRFAEAANPPFWAVYHETVDAEGRTHQHLVLTQQATRTAFGTWSGLDARIVDRIREIDSQGRSGYDFAAEVEKQNVRAREAHKQAFREKMGEIGERGAHAVRKDIGSTARAVISREI